MVLQWSCTLFSFSEVLYTLAYVFEGYYLMIVKVRQRRLLRDIPMKLKWLSQDNDVPSTPDDIDPLVYFSRIHFYKVKVDTTISDTMVLPASKDKEDSRERWALKRRCTSLNKRSDTSMFDVSLVRRCSRWCCIEIEKRNDMHYSSMRLHKNEN